MCLMSGVTTLSAYHNNMKYSERGQYFHDILCTKLAWIKCTPVREYFLWAVRTGGMGRFLVHLLSHLSFSIPYKIAHLPQ